MPPSPLTQNVTAQLRKMLEGEPSPARLESSLRLLGKWRGVMVSETLRARSGTKILSGPFAGMDYDTPASEGAHSARMIGCYEASLHPVIETIIARAYPLVIDIGSAEGYYAIGLARRMPKARVLARDANPVASRLCGELAAKNGVADRVEVGGIFTHDDLAICAGQPTVIICDIEGAEADLLDPARAPALAKADILVEVHDGMVKGLTQTLTNRFAATHRVTRLDRRLDDSGLPPWMETLSDMDRLMALWEWRSAPTPWLWMEHK